MFLLFHPIHLFSIFWLAANQFEEREMEEREAEEREMKEREKGQLAGQKRASRKSVK